MFVGDQLGSAEPELKITDGTRIFSSLAPERALRTLFIARLVRLYIMLPVTRSLTDRCTGVPVVINTWKYCQWINLNRNRYRPDDTFLTIPNNCQIEVYFCQILRQECGI